MCDGCSTAQILNVEQIEAKGGEEAAAKQYAEQVEASEQAVPLASKVHQNHAVTDLTKDFLRELAIDLAAPKDSGPEVSVLEQRTEAVLAVYIRYGDKQVSAAAYVLKQTLQEDHFRLSPGVVNEAGEIVGDLGDKAPVISGLFTAVQDYQKTGATMQTVSNVSTSVVASAVGADYGATLGAGIGEDVAGVGGCEVVGGGPEDPFADACAAGAVLGGIVGGVLASNAALKLEHSIVSNYAVSRFPGQGGQNLVVITEKSRS